MIRGYDYYGSGKGHDDSADLKQSGPTVLKQDSDQNDEHRREGHDDGNVNRVAIAQRHVEEIHEAEQAEGATEEYARYHDGDALGLH